MKMHLLSLCVLTVPVAACASHSVIPLSFASSDGRITGLVDHAQLYMRVDGMLMNVSKPQHLISGRTSLLLNTDTEDGHYLSLAVDEGVCPIQGGQETFKGAIRIGSATDHRDRPIQDVCGRKISRTAAKRIRKTFE